MDEESTSFMGWSIKKKCECNDAPSLFWIVFKLVLAGGILLFAISQLVVSGTFDETGSLLYEAYASIPYHSYFLYIYLFFGIMLLGRRFWIFLQNNNK